MVARSPFGLLLELYEQAIRSGVAPSADAALGELALSAGVVHRPIASGPWPLSAARMGIRLTDLGFFTRAGRATALMELGAELPPVVLSKLLGIHIHTATAWSQAAPLPDTGPISSPPCPSPRMTS